MTFTGRLGSLARFLALRRDPGPACRLPEAALRVSRVFLALQLFPVR